MAPLTNYLRMWDVASANGVDDFIANSQNVQNRIWKSYRRFSRIVYPPVAVETFYTAAPDNYYLVVSELVSYKRIDDAVRCFTRTGRRLKIVGHGPEYSRLKNMAGRSVEFCGRVSDSELRDLYARSRAVLFPGEEDFGLVPVEALASGKPVIALGRGGVLESVPVSDTRCGFFYDIAGERPLQAALEAFERDEGYVVASRIRSYAARFSADVFRREMWKLLFGATAPEESGRVLKMGVLK